ncbi:MAG: M14 family zinc carboxypeptidase [Xanthomonadales bacterium]
MKTLTTLLALLLTGTVYARSAADYLPPDADPDPAIPTPESVLGWDVGAWHVSHDKLVQYLEALADASPRVALEVTGHTWEQRPLLLLTITAEDRQDEIESLRQAHLAGDGPLVVWLGYSVHGNEASGSNAALLTAYYLAAARSDFVRELLDGTVVLIDPAINPDGLNRFASWANQNAALNPVGRWETREHSEHWPGGRTNHYWFDLNRDWLPLVHPESRARVAQFQRWRPHVLTDHHEQGRLPGFFFQPGVPSRQNPLTPPQNLELTRALAAFHAEALDAVGQPYFTEESYDDFYFGKGSTYPDINGSIGILFEQRSIRGRRLDTSNGVETFGMAIDNQLTVSLSTLRGAWALRERLKEYQRGFDGSMRQRADRAGFDAWVIGDDGDPARARALLETFDVHGVTYRPLGETVRTDGHEFQPGGAWVVPADQDRFGLIQGMLETRTEFADNTFYDVSAWTLPLAYNLPFATLGRMPKTGPATQASEGMAPLDDAVAWAVPWNQVAAAPLLQQLLDADARVRTAIKSFTARTAGGLVAFDPGTLIVQRGIQEDDRLPAIRERLGEAALNGATVASLTSTLTASGPDLGSINFPLLKPVRPLIVGGAGVTAYDAGEHWHLLDHRLGVAVPVVEMQRLGRVDLAEYTHLLLPDGEYRNLSARDEARIARWIRDGGILVGTAGGAQWAEDLCYEPDPKQCSAADEDDSDEAPPAARAYADYDDDRAERVIGGAIAATTLDLSHPIAFGYRRPELPLFRRGTVTLKPSPNPYATPVRYTSEPLVAGFIGPERLDAMRRQPAVIAEREGKGLIVRFANNPLFRGYWRGTERLFINALYFGQVIGNTDLPKVVPPPAPEEPRD